MTSVAVVLGQPPDDVWGGAERAAQGLVDAIAARGHEAALVRLPFPERTFAEVVDGYRRFAELDLSAFDVVVPKKYPAWMVAHPRKAVWMVHALRGLYDTYDRTGLPTAVPPDRAREPEVQAVLRALDRLAAEPARRLLAPVFDAAEHAVARLGADHPALQLPGPLLRRVVHALDAFALAPGETVRWSTNSRVCALREGYLPAGVRPHVAHTPPDLPGLAEQGAASARRPELFTASRLDRPKRMDLVIEGLRRSDAALRLTIGGRGPDAERLHALAGDDDRISFPGFVPDAAVLDGYRHALAVPFVPEGEEYGLIAVEAMAAGAPVVTATDSGGPTELVEHGRTGLVVPPTPGALAAAFEALAADPAWAASLGAAARARVAPLSWDVVLRQVLGDLLEPDRPAPPAPAPPRAPVPAPVAPVAAVRGRRPRIVLLSTFRVHPASSGGPLRVAHVARSLAARADVTIVALGAKGDEASSVEVAPGLREVVVPPSTEFLRLHDDLGGRARAAVGDTLAGLGHRTLPLLREAVLEAVGGADLAVLEHPFLYPLLHDVAPHLPFVYDAHNVELDLKAAMYAPSATGELLLAGVAAVEAEATRRAALVVATSAEDAALLASRHGLDAAAVALVPNGCDLRRPPVIGEARREASRRWLERAGRSSAGLVLYVASWHGPNIEAAVALLGVAAGLPGLTFAFVGGHCGAIEGQRRPRNAVLLGRVPDLALRTLLGAADVAANPMLAGSGTNLKLLEYFAGGAPVVSSTFGARGSGAEDGVHARLATVGRFTDAVAEVAVDHAGADERARAARRLVEERFDWADLSPRYADLLLALV